jgi:hypothetical protein
MPTPVKTPRSPRSAPDSGKTDLEWAWEFHKNCDQLLHQRLTAFTNTQAMTLAAFTLLTIARFNTAVPAERIGYFEAGRVLIAVLGLIMALLGGLVTYPMYRRLQYLNTQFLIDKLPGYREYVITSLDDMRLPLIRLKFPLRVYRSIIPIWLPLVEVAFWVILLILLVAGISDTAQRLG